MSTPKVQCAVVGGGPAGLVAAIALADAGFTVASIAPEPPTVDRRSSALVGASAAILSGIGVLEAIRQRAAPLATMRLVDATDRVLRAPTVEFRADEIGVSAFGFNVPNADLSAILTSRAEEFGERRLKLLRSSATHIQIGPEAAEIALSDGTSVVADLLVGADGRRSVVREAAGIGQRTWSYPQCAVVLDLRHELPHGNVSTEFHTRNGPFTQVPLPGRRSSLVWVDTPEVAALAAGLRPDRLAETVEARMFSILGKVEIEGEPQTFPLSGAVATAMTARRVALVGEAAHVFPPIGAQGLNLGLRDAADLVAATARHRDDPGSGAVLRAYARRRGADVLARTAGVDLLNRSLLADALPVQAARGIGLRAMEAVPVLRRFAMREGAAPGAGPFGLSKAVREALGGAQA